MSIILLILFIFISYVFLNYIKKFKNYGPKSLKGPIPLPIFGNLLSLLPLPHIPLTKYHETYGPVYRIWMGDKYTVSVNDIDIAKKIFIKNADCFMEHPETPTFKFYSCNYSNLVMGRGQNWKQRRDLVARSITKTKIKHIYTNLDQQLDGLLNCMDYHVKSGLPFTPRGNFSRFTMNNMLKLVMNDEIPYDHQGKSQGPMKDLIHQCEVLFTNLGSGNIGDFIDLLKPFLSIYYKLTNSCLPKILDIVGKVLQKHVDTFKEEYKSNPRDLFDVMLVEYDFDPLKYITIILIACDLLFAGSDTVAGSLEWANIFLCNYPEYQEKVYSELLCVVGKDRKVALSDRISTPFLNAFIKESSRFKTIGPFNIPRNCSQDIEIDDYFIPKDSQVILNFSGIAANTKYWDNPQVFDPTRHLEKNQEFSLFGYGQRQCVGSNFGQDELYLSLSNMILKYKFSSHDGNLINESEAFGLTLHPATIFKLKLEHR
ncbi:hypothetical protein CYY_001438 [Polysphondylium violaceum]|uniref:Cytochrome P450 family protein n=1 Tax=Polysphondylium violaceum TaxID=133409 RepID=A0A8J4VAK5_9MYCE|nr:hypothetical protein CYY_001438 [Polysphondylium violaceum]